MKNEITWLSFSFQFHFRSIIIQHPLRRLLSTYLLLFRHTDAHISKGISNHIYNFWLKHRKDKLVPEANEIKTDSESRPTITFRQFVHFLLKCPEEVTGCGVSNLVATTLHICQYFFIFFFSFFAGMVSSKFRTKVEPDVEILPSMLGKYATWFPDWFGTYQRR